MNAIESVELTRPAQIDLVTAESVESELEHEHSLLVELQQRAAEALEHAAELERRMSRQGLDPQTTAWMLLRFQQYVGGLRRECDDEVVAILASARRQATLIRRRQALPLTFAGALGAATTDWFDELVVLERESIRWVSLEVSAPMVSAPVVKCTEPSFPLPVPVPLAHPGVVSVATAIATEVPWEPPPAPEPVLSTHWPPVELGTDGSSSEFSPVFADDGRSFWAPDTRPPWWRRRRLSSAGALQLGAGVLTVAALAVHFA